MDKQRTTKVKKRAGKVVHTAVAAHAAERAREIHARYGPRIDYPVLLNILNDRKCLRYPVQIKFAPNGIERGLFAITEPVSKDPSDGYVITVLEQFEKRPDVLPALILYQAVIVNYGELATAADAEIFGAGVLGMDREEYYSMICDLTGSVWQNAEHKPGS